MITKNKMTVVTVVFAFFAFTFMAIAQTVTNAPPGAEPLPKSMFEFWTLGIAAVTPLIVAGIRKFIPKVPKLLLPVSTPFVGIGLGLLVNWVANQHLTWVGMAQAGALAVFIRETINQASKTAMVQNLKGESSKT
jgi:hypothetical protein